MGIDNFNLDTELTKMSTLPLSPNAQLIDYLNFYEANNLEAIYQFNKKYNEYVSECTGKGEIPATGSACYNKGTALQVDAGNITKWAKYESDLFNFIKTKKDTDPTTYGRMADEYKSENDRTSRELRYSKIMSKYEDVTKKRDDLDSKLRELYDIPGSKSLDYKYNYDATIYSGILITIVASAVVYYDFTRL